MFRRFSELEIDDIITVTTSYGTYDYKIYDMQLIWITFVSKSIVIISGLDLFFCTAILLTNETFKSICRPKNIRINPKNAITTKKATIMFLNME